jgi:hypothetical protein
MEDVQADAVPAPRNKSFSLVPTPSASFSNAHGLASGARTLQSFTSRLRRASAVSPPSLTPPAPGLTDHDHDYASAQQGPPSMSPRNRRASAYAPGGGSPAAAGRPGSLLGAGESTSGVSGSMALFSTTQSIQGSSRLSGRGGGPSGSGRAARDVVPSSQLSGSQRSQPVQGGSAVFGNSATAWVIAEAGEAGRDDPHGESSGGDAGGPGSSSSPSLGQAQGSSRAHAAAGNLASSGSVRVQGMPLQAQLRGGSFTRLARDSGPSQVRPRQAACPQGP